MPIFIPYLILLGEPIEVVPSTLNRITATGEDRIAANGSDREIAD